MFKPEQRNRGILTELKGSKVPSFLLYGFLEFGTFTLATGMLNLILRQWRGMSDSMISAIFAINSIMGCLILMMIPKLTRQAKLSDIARSIASAMYIVAADDNCTNTTAHGLLARPHGIVQLAVYGG